MIALLVLLAIPPGIATALTRTLHLAGWGRTAVALVLLAATYVLYIVLVRRGERRQVCELAPRPAARELTLGLVVGTGMFLLVFALIRLAGAYTIARGQWTDWAHDAAAMIAVGFMEELIARLVVFRLLMRAMGAWPALIGSALLFGAAHLANPNATAVAALAIAVEAGLMLAAFYLVTGRIWMSVGVHIAWNFVQGPILGASVSGHAERGSLFVSAPVTGAPTWLSGGAFGPEASLPAMIVGLAIFALLMRGYVRRERLDTAPALA